MGNNPSRNASGHSSAAQGSPSTSLPSSGPALPPQGNQSTPKRHGSQRRPQHPLHLFPHHHSSHSHSATAPPSPCNPAHPSSTPATPIPSASYGFYPSPARKAAPSLESESVPVVRSRAISQPGEHAASHSPSWLPPGYREQGRKGSLPVAIPNKSPALAPQPSSHPGSVAVSGKEGAERGEDPNTHVRAEYAGTIMAGTSEAASMPPRLKKRPSVGSATTLGDEEMADDDSKTVPTIIQWPHGGNKVYVTGTFANWRKKFPLTKRYLSPTSIL